MKTRTHQFTPYRCASCLGGDVNAGAERYARYHEQVHGESVDAKTLIPEFLRAFFDADREFQSWSHSSGKRPGAPRPSCSSSHGCIKVER